MPLSKSQDTVETTDYDFPFGMDLLRKYEKMTNQRNLFFIHQCKILFIFRWKWTYYIPFLPTYKANKQN